MNLRCQYNPRSQYLLPPATTHPKRAVTDSRSQSAFFNFAHSFHIRAHLPARRWLNSTCDISHCVGHYFFLVGWMNKCGTVVAGGLAHFGLPAYLSSR